MQPYICRILALVAVCSFAVSGAAAPSPAAAGPALRVKVDPRIELLSLIFRLAGNPEYNQGRVDSYTADVQKQFGSFSDHAAIRLAADLRSTRGVSYDACMGMAVHLNDAAEPALRTALVPWPESLDRRWTPGAASNFVAAARQFVKDARFQEFVAAHQALYQTAESRLKKLVDEQAHLEWFKEFFGERPQASFTVIPGLLNGGCCYGAHFRETDGKEELFCVLGVWKTDAEGQPVFTADMLDTIIHEFGHSYANPLIDRHLKELRAPGQKLFQQVASRMRSQAYGEPPTMLRESLLRACVVRYVGRYGGAEAARKMVASEKKRGFLWIQELSDLLGEYEAHRAQYPTLDAFAPRLVSFFNDYARDFGGKQAASPKVVSMTPANGATNVDPALTAIRVTFDRPMQDQSWSMCGGGPNYPETTGQPHYDAPRTVWSVPVRLKPGWDYEFGLNSVAFDAFRSQEGVPLEPIVVKFRTAGQ